jgi:hypothetical protein
LPWQAAAVGSGASSGSPGTGSADIAQQSAVLLDMQTVEGCFNAGGHNTHEAPGGPWFDLIDLGGAATSQGQGAFSTFGDYSDDLAFYFFMSHDQAERMVKKANLDAHGAHVTVMENVIVARYSDLSPAESQLEKSCLR